jgi:hypothetical protein
MWDLETKLSKVFFLQFVYCSLEIMSGIVLETLPYMWVDILSWFSPITLFLMLMLEPILLLREKQQHQY